MVVVDECSSAGEMRCERAKDERILRQAQDSQRKEQRAQLLLSCELLQAEADHLQRVLGGPQADALAVAGDLELAHLGVMAVRQANIDQADGLAGVGT